MTSSKLQTVLRKAGSELEAPEFGAVIELAPGLLWTRVPVPMSVRHVNIYLLADDGGWAVIDAGFGDDDTFDIWERLADGPLKGERFTRLIVTHGHADHVGAAGWLCRRFDIPLYMSEIEYLTTWMELANPTRLRTPFYTDAFRRMGADDDLIKAMTDHAGRYGKGVGTLPESFHPLVEHDSLRIGPRDFKIFLGPGHSPGQAMLHSAGDNLFICADHVLDKVAPLLIVPTSSLADDTYRRFMWSLDEIERNIRSDVTLLPAHYLPHAALAGTLSLIRKHHGNRLRTIAEACRHMPLTILEMAHLLFGRALNGRQTYYAILEALAYLNYEVHAGRLMCVSSSGLERFGVPNQA